MSWIVKVLGTKIVKNILVTAAKTLAARTDNKVDDQLVAAIEKAVKKM